jgi:hypothetical protein
MKSHLFRLISITCLAMGTAMQPIAQAQGVTVISNLDEPSTGSLAVGSDSWVDQVFSIVSSDPNTYSLNSIDLMMLPASGSPSGFDVSIYSSPLGSGGGPQTFLGSLAGSLDPANGGVYTFTATNIAIEADTFYHVVATSTTPIGQGAYYWSMVAGGKGSGTWTIANAYGTSSDGITWEGHNREGALQLAIYATVVPEPSTFALLGLGSLALVMRGRGGVPSLTFSIHGPSIRNR